MTPAATETLALTRRSDDPMTDSLARELAETLV